MMIKSEFYPSAFQVCGNVASDHSHQVVFKLMESKLNVNINDYVANTEQGSGDFCQFLPPGKYSANVKVTEKETAKGIQFFPVDQMLTLTDHAHMGLFFTQLKTTVVGHVRCISPVDCQKVQVHLFMKMDKPSNKEMEHVKYTAPSDGTL